MTTEHEKVWYSSLFGLCFAVMYATVMLFIYSFSSCCVMLLHFAPFTCTLVLI
jgi:hypothetical protein